MVEAVHNLPSPESDIGGEPKSPVMVGNRIAGEVLSSTSANTPPQRDGRTAFRMTPGTDGQAEPSSADESSILGGTGVNRRNVDPPRNEQGKIICQHPSASPTCATLTFDRKCEWSKHMDKHERPYICEEPGCEKLRGFTYSGGLLRHRREVHRMNGGPKETLMCPYEHCKRSVGAGFTRKENLNEHIRRVHRPATELNGLSQNKTGAPHTAPGAEDGDVSSIYDNTSLFDTSPATSAHPSSTPNNGVGSRRPRKRKQPDGEGGSTELQEKVQNELRDEIKRLRRDAEEKDLRIQRLETDLRSLMAAGLPTPTLPQQQQHLQLPLQPPQQQHGEGIDSGPGASSAPSEVAPVDGPVAGSAAVPRQHQPVTATTDTTTAAAAATATDTQPSATQSTAKGAAIRELVR